jgi:hypothetical protein
MTDLADYTVPDGYGTTIGKCLTFAEIEGLLAAERERCAALCEQSAAVCGAISQMYDAGSRPYFEFYDRQDEAEKLAAAIRNLPPQT